MLFMCKIIPTVPLNKKLLLTKTPLILLILDEIFYKFEGRFQISYCYFFWKTRT